ncbi:hypothetical protein [Paenibacillus sp. SYP-B4298]|uniref:hypothetical protein n=1 Tax=Paenibacillus sp. SYP-B4298 TaxID=2996034 RepID=UPI0022DDAF0B|nr:hypothetical protein [Paenibacillus sp. SYP-B4298]
MSYYWKLVHMEIHRFRYVLVSMMGLVALVQLGAIALYTLDEVAIRQEYIRQHGMWIRQELSFPQAMVDIQLWHTLPVLLCAAILALYMFIIWYRDWFGGHTFIYRLLMLPTARSQIYWAKLTAILVFALSLIGFQVLLMWVEYGLFMGMVPSELVAPSYIAEGIEVNTVLNLLLPRTFEYFIYRFGLGVLMLLIVFNAILLERSYRRLIGIGYAVGYVIVCLLVTLLPLLFKRLIRSDYLYPEEFVMLEWLACLLVAAGSAWLGSRLLKKKITV